MAFRNLSVLLYANDANFRTVMTRAGSQVDKFSNQVKAANKETSAAGVSMAKGFGVAAIAVGIALSYAVKQAAEFEVQMRNVNSISHMSETALRAVSSRVLALSRQLPQSATTLASGLYDIASSGFQGAAGLKVLEASGKAASAGLSDTATAAKAITGVLNAYGLEAEQSAYVSDVLFQTVNLGVVTFSELAGQLGDVVGIAAAAHVSIDQVGSAIATMTLSGVNAAESTTALNRLIQDLIQPSEALAVVLQEQGYASGELALQQLGLHGTMEMIRKVTGGNVEALQKLFPDIRALKGAFALTAAEGKNYNRVAAEIENKSRVAGATQKAFNEQMKAFSNQLKLIGNRANAFAITIGTKLLPVLLDAVNALDKLVQEGVAIALAGAERLTPAWESLTKAFHNSVDAIGQIIKLIAPIAGMLGAVAATGIIAFLDGFAKALELLTGFVDHNKVAVDALAIVIGITLVKSLQAAVAGFAIAKWEAFGTVVAATAVKVRTAVGAFLLMAQVSGGGLVGSLRAAGDALRAFLGSPAGTATLIVASLFLIHNAIQNIRNDGRQWAREWVADLHVTEDSLGGLEDGIGKIDMKIAQMTQHVVGENKFKKFFQSLGDETLSAFGMSGAINSAADEWAKIDALTDQEKAKLVAKYEHLNTELNKTFQDTGLADKFKAEYGATISLTEDFAKELEGKLNIKLPAPTDMGNGIKQVFVDVKNQNWNAVASQVGFFTEQLDQLAAAAQAAGLDLSTDFSGKLTDLISKMQGASPAGQRTVLSIQAIADAADVGTDKIDKLTNAIKSLTDEALGLEQSEDDARSAMNKMVQASIDQNKHKVSFKGSTDESIAFRDATRDVVSSLGKVVSAQAEAGATSGELKNTIKFLTQSFYDQAVAAGVPKEKAKEYADVLRKLPPSVFTKFDPTELDKMIGKAKDGKGKLKDIDKAKVKPKVTADTSEFDTAMDHVETRLRKVGSTTTTVHPDVHVPTGSASFASANGNILYYATGGIAEDHKAQIAPAGAMRMWAEPETGGEAYIPLAKTKRTRSLKLLRTVAKIFGMKVEAYAAGAIINAQHQQDARVAAAAATLGGAASFQAAGHAAVKGIDPAKDAQQYQEAWNSALMDVAKTYDEVRRAAGKQAADALANSGLVGQSFQDAAQKIIEAAQNAKAKVDALNANMYETHALPADRYLAYLRRRLAGLRKYSDEWMQIWREIQSVKADQKTANDALKQQRTDAVQAAKDLLNSVVDPVRQATDAIKTFSGQTQVTANDIDAFFKHQIEATNRFNAALKRLQALGLNPTMLNEIAQQGPQALGLAETLVSEGAAGIASVNRQQAQLNANTAAIGATGAGILGIKVPAGAGSTTVNLGGINVKITGTGANNLTKADVNKAVKAAFAQLVAQLKAGTH